MSWLAAGLRTDAATRLRALNTLAGISVETSRASAIPDELIPFIGVYTDLQENALQSIAGSEPRFDTKLHLVIEPKVQGSPSAQAEAQLDTIVGQVLDGLLTDHLWLEQFDRVSSVTINTGIDAQGSAYTGLARIVFVLEYTERYPPILPTPFTAVDLTETVGTQQLGVTIVIPTS